MTLIGRVPDGDTAQTKVNVKVANSIVTEPYDYISITEGETTDTFVFKTGGVSGTTIATVTLTYSDSTKSSLQSVAKT